jgi:hypothetical protein
MYIPKQPMNNKLNSNMQLHAITHLCCTVCCYRCRCGVVDDAEGVFCVFFISSVDNVSFGAPLVAVVGGFAAAAASAAAFAAFAAFECSRPEMVAAGTPGRPSISIVNHSLLC